MAVFCAIGLFIFASMLLIVTGIGVFNGAIASLVAVMVICGLASIMNIMWFVVAFRSNNHRSVTVSH
ncbi:hypothetical protein J2S17_002483 [Cytobacillus purgationiresistens]|uniref:Uncharacterized protein n=2 Tax=Cytobacillus purgationiresistens TaxID=863449 RepID=A0ABU0AH77_9BACI|nr:hypothetical protein [Cytobacillus purgationiresistens]